MKKALLIIGILFLLAGTQNCKSQSTEVVVPVVDNNQDQLKRIWMLVEFQNFSKEDLIKNKAQMNLKDFKIPSANMGCNSISFNCVVKKDNLKFIAGMRTEMFCENKMQLEDAFCLALQGDYSYKIAGQKLFLSNSKNEKMTFVAQDWD